MTDYHIPVLKDECLEALKIKPNGVYVDLTFGGGGHSKAILEQLSPEGRLLVFDQDRSSWQNIPQDSRLIFAHSNFRFLKRFVRYHNLPLVDGILGDLGVSSHHFDTPERGFSFRFEGELDMRMNQNQERSAATILNTYTQEALTHILQQYGELKKAYYIAKLLIAHRANTPITQTHQLVEALEPITPKHQEHKFLAKVFQALRIETNQEMQALEHVLTQTLEVLAPAGRLAIISYHSLEDRLVKNFLRHENFTGAAQTDNIYGGKVNAQLQLITRKPIEASAEEIERNNRARSAKLRVAEKLKPKP